MWVTEQAIGQKYVGQNHVLAIEKFLPASFSFLWMGARIGLLSIAEPSWMLAITTTRCRIQDTTAAFAAIPQWS